MYAKSSSSGANAVSLGPEVATGMLGSRCRSSKLARLMFTPSKLTGNEVPMGVGRTEARVI